MNLLKKSLFLSTSLYLGMHGVWAMEDDFKGVEKNQLSLSLKKSNSPNLEKKMSNDFVVISLAPTKLPRKEVEDNFSNSFSYQWKIRADHLKKKTLSIRNYAEHVPFVDLVELIGTHPNISKDQQYSVRFTKHDKRTILDLYFQGKLDLSWTHDGLHFKQYCALADAPLHTLSIKSKEKNITYYKQQRYADTQFSKVTNVFCDSDNQIEYWFDDEKEKWVVDHPDKGEIEFPTHKKALRALKSDITKLSSPDETVTFFMHPYKQWQIDKANEEYEEESSPSLWQAGFLGWLALSGDVLDTLRNAPAFRMTNGAVEENSSSNRALISPAYTSLSSAEGYEPLMNVGSSFSLYSLVPPLLISLLSSKDRKFNYLQFFSMASAVFPFAQAKRKDENTVISSKNKPTVTTYMNEGINDVSKKLNPIIEDRGGISLSEGVLKYEEKENVLLQILHSNEQTVWGKVQVFGGVKVSHAAHEKIVGWGDDKQNKKCWRNVVYCAKQGSEEVCDSKEYRKGPYQYLEKRSFLKPQGNPMLKNYIPVKHSAKPCKEYEDCRGGIVEECDHASEFPVDIEHLNFEQSADGLSSYQAVTLKIKRDGKEYDLRPYKITDILFPHIITHIRWEDDRDRHLSTKVEKVTLNLKSKNGMSPQDESNIKDEERIIKAENKTEVGHRPLYWFLQVLPGNNWEIIWNKVRYR